MAVIGCSYPDFDVVTSQGKSAYDEHLPFVVVLRGAPPTVSTVSPDVRPITNESDQGWTSAWRSERGMVEFNHVTGSVRVDGDEHVKADEARTLVLLVDASEPRAGVQRVTVAGIPAPTRYRAGPRKRSWPMRVWQRLQEVRAQLARDDRWLTTVLNEPAVSAFVSQSGVRAR